MVNKTFLEEEEEEKRGQTASEQTEWAAKGLRPASEQKDKTAPLVVNLDTLNNDSAVSVASRIPVEDEKNNFLESYRDQISSKKSPNYQAYVPTLKELNERVDERTTGRIANMQNMGALAGFGLFDVNGNDINVNTASPQMIVQGIQGIGDTNKRKEAAKVFIALTQTKGSRFYGFTTDADLSAFRDSAEMTLNGEGGYNSIVDGYRRSFYAGEGHEQENAEAYRYHYEQIQMEQSGYTRRLLTEALEQVYRDTTYAESAPDMHTPEAEQAAEAVDNAESLEETAEDVPPSTGLLAGEAEREDLEAEQTEPMTETAAPTSAQTAQEVGRWIEKAPGWQKEQEPEEEHTAAQTAQEPIYLSTKDAGMQTPVQEKTMPYITTQDAGDVVALMKRGRYDMIDPNDPNRAYVEELYQDANVRKLNGVLSDEANAEIEAGNVGAEYEQTLSLGSFGTTIQLAYQAIHAPDFPPELYGDSMMILNEVVRDAGKAIERGEIATDPTAENAFEAFFKANPAQMEKVKSIEDAKNALIANQNELRTQQQQKTEQSIRDARTAILNGSASDEQWALYRENISADTREVAEAMADSALWMDVSSFGGDFWTGGGYANSSIKAGLDAAGIVSYDTGFMQSLRGEMHSLLQEDTEMAVSLGMTADEYHQFIGGMSADQLASRAYLRMQEQGASITREEQEALSGGAGVGGLAVVGYGAVHGVQSLWGSYNDSLYMGLTMADVERTGAKMRNHYQREFGTYGADYYRRALREMIDSGELNESFASALKQAMNEARDIYDIGIDPQARGFLLANASQARKGVEQLDTHMTENATPGEQKWYQRVSSMTENAGQAVIATAGTLAAGSVLGTGKLAMQIAGEVGFALGYDIPGWGDRFTQRLDEGYSLSSAAHMSSLDTAASHLSNSGTFSKIFGRMTGATTLERAGWFNAMQKNPSGAAKALAAVAKFTGSAAGNIVDEAVTDEFKENIAAQTVDAVFGPVYRKIDAGESVGAGDVIAILADAPKNISVSGAAKEVAANFTEAAITTSLFALVGASGETYNSIVKAKEITSGKSSDIQGFVEAVAEDAQNPEFIETINTDAKAQQLEERTVEVLIMDDGKDGKIAAAQKTQEQADSHKAEMNASMARMENAKKTYFERKKAGDIDAANAALMDFAKAKQGFEEHTREAKQKDYEANQIRESKMQDARMQASKEVAQEAVGAREAVATEQAARSEAETRSRESGNIAALDAEDFLAERYPNATEEQRQAVYAEFAQGESGDAKLTKANAEFASRIARKFGVKIQFGDISGAQGAYSRDADTITLDPNATQGDVIRSTMVHELAHRTEISGEYDSLSNALISLKYGVNSAQLDADVRSIMSRYEAYYAQQGRGEVFTEADARRELVADAAAEIIGGNEEMITRLVADEPSVARRILNAIKNFIDKLRGVRDPEMDNLRRVEALFEKALKNSGEGQGEQYSIRRDANGQAYVEIEEDILDGIPEKDWAKTVKNKLREKFPNGVTVGRNQIKITGKSRGELTESKYTRWLKNNEPTEYADKLRAVGNADEILYASGDYVNEGLNHPRNDHIVDFARGTVVMEIGGNAYDASVIVGTKDDGDMVLYDLVDMKKTAIKKKTQRTAGHQSAPHDRSAASSNTSIADASADVNTQSTQNQQLSLPSQNLLRQEIAAWRGARQSEAQQEDARRQGERQFVKKTLQNSRAMPSYIRQTLFNDPTSRYYEMDSNDEQIVRAYQTIEQEGRQAAIERILTNRGMATKNEIAQANVLMAQAAHDGDLSTLLALSRHYAEDTTEIAQALQAMKIFKRMTPAGAMEAAAAQIEGLLAEYIRGHEPMRREVEAKAREIETEIEKKRGGDPIALLGSGEMTLTKENSKWGVPLNERQEALIEKYKLQNVARPGIHYNRATVEQRMLEAILAMPDPLEGTNEGLTLISRLEYMKKGAPVVTNADIEYIGHQLELYTAMSEAEQEDRIGQLALARAYEANANITQATLSEKINGRRFVNMLLNLTSPMRNVMGNTLQTGVNATSDAVAVVLDNIIALGTKTHTKAFISPKELVQGWKAFAQETKDTFRDYFVDKAIVRQGEGRFDVNRRGRVYQGWLAETERNVESFLMSVGDRNFWKMAYTNSMAEQMRVAKKNKQELDFEAAHEQAERDANYATFNEDNRVRDALTQLKNAGAVGKGIDMLMPFTGVPTNIMKRQLEYGPVGLGYTCIRHAKRAATKQTFDQRAFVEELSRGLTGVGLAALGFGLAQIGGIIGGTSEEEESERYYMRTAEGDQYTPFIKVGDEYVSLSTFSPAVSPIIMGAMAYEAWKGDADIVQAFTAAVSSSLDSIIDASYFSSLQEILTGEGTFPGKVGKELLSTLPSQGTPSLVSQIASMMDPYVRDTKDANWVKQSLNKLMARIPGLRETLPIKYDVTGDAVENSKYGWRALLDPFTTTKAEDDEAVSELMALSDRTGETSFLTGYLISSGSYKLSVTKTLAQSTRTGNEAYKLELTAEQKNEVNRRYADLLYNGGGSIEGLRSLIDTPMWKRMDDEERIEEVRDMKSAAKAEVTKWAVKEYGG